MPPAKLSGDLVVEHDHWNDRSRCEETTNDTAQSGVCKESDNDKQYRCDEYAQDKKIRVKAFPERS
jgi:hypothetical protein